MLKLMMGVSGINISYVIYSGTQEREKLTH